MLNVNVNVNANANEEVVSNEEWKDIVIEQDGKVYDFSSYYQVSNLGRVRSVRNNKLLIQHPTHNGYLRVGLYKDGERLNCRVNRLVAFAFLEIPEGADVNTLDVNHLNEDKTCNVYTNLAWCTRRENINHATANQRRGETMSIKVICTDTEVVYSSLTKASEETGCSLSGISKCCNGTQESCNNCHWRFYNDYLIEQLIVA